MQYNQIKNTQHSKFLNLWDANQKLYKLHIQDKKRIEKEKRKKNKIQRNSLLSASHLLGLNVWHF